MSNKNKIKKTTGEKIFDAFNVLFLIFASFITLYPIWHEVCLSFSVAEHAMRGGLFFWPRGFTTRAYQLVFEQKTIYSAYANSVFVSVMCTVLSVILQSGIAYALTKKLMPGQKIFLGMLLFSMMFNGGLIPNYLLIKNLGLIDNHWALILPRLVTPFNVFIIRNFFAKIPEELEESALIDGASPIRVFISIIIPLSTPVLATVSLWEAVKSWNNFFSALIYINTKVKYTLPLLVNEVINTSKAANEIGAGEYALASTVAATIVLAVAPILMIYPFLQRFFVKGVMVGSVKG